MGAPPIVSALQSARRRRAFNPSRLVQSYGGFWLPPSALAGAALPAIDSWSPTKAGVTTGDLVQATGSAKPSVAQVAGLDTASFDGGDFLKSNAAASAWKWLHAADGASLFVVVRRTGGAGVQAILDTCNGNTFQHGFALFYNQGTNLLYAYVMNGTGTAVAIPTLDFDNWSGNQSELHIVEFAWSQADGYLLRVNGGGGARVATGSIVGTPSTNDPSGPLTVGSIVIGTIQFLTGNVAEVVGLVGVPPAAERASVVEYLSKRWSVPLA